MDLDKLLNQTATYWAPSSIDGFNVVTFSTPESVSCRWEDKQELFLNYNMDQELSHAVVYLNQDIEIGGYLYLGTSTAVDPGTVDGAREIRAFNKIPNVKATKFLRKAWL
jgi:phenylalanyl-tRNA synthetase beta subunit